MVNRKAVLAATGILMPILSITAIVLRFIARRVRKVHYGLDDWLIVAASVFTIALCADTLVGWYSYQEAFAGQFGNHERYTPAGHGTGSTPEESMRQLLVRGKTIWVLQWLGALGPGLTRLSVLFLYKRLFLGRVFQISNWILIVISAIWTTSFFFGNFLDCVPLRNNWAHTAEANKHCIKLVPLFWAMTISDVIIDAMILTLPWYPVWNLQMPVAKKLSVCGIFLLGAFVVGAGVARVTAIRVAVTSTSDFSWSQSPASYWAAIEAGVGIVSACLPTLWPLIKRPGVESLIRRAQRKIASSWSRSRLVKQRQDDSFSKISPSSDSVESRKPIVFEGRGGEQHHINTRVTAAESSFSAPSGNVIELQSSVFWHEQRV